MKEKKVSITSGGKLFYNGDFYRIESINRNRGKIILVNIIKGGISSFSLDDVEESATGFESTYSGQKNIKYKGISYYLVGIIKGVAYLCNVEVKNKKYKLVPVKDLFNENRKGVE